VTHPEADLQIQVVDLLRLYESRMVFIFWSTPNELLGSARSKGGLARMARFKRMGLRPGVADLVIVKNGRIYFLELKSETGRQSEIQKKFQNDAIGVGADYALAHNLDEAIYALKIWGIIPKEVI